MGWWWWIVIEIEGLALAVLLSFFFFTVPSSISGGCVNLWPVACDYARTAIFLPSSLPPLLVFGASLTVTLSVCLGGIPTQNSVHVDARVFLFSKGEHGI